MRHLLTRACLAAVVSAVLAQVLVLAPTSAATQPAAPSVAPVRPFVGAPFTVRGVVPGGFPRTVRLQIWNGAKYTNRAVTTADSRGRYSFARTSADSALRVRAAVSATKRSGRTHPAVTTRVRVFYQGANTVAVRAPASAHEGSPFTIVATTTPAVAGRTLHLERQAGTTWGEVASASSTADGSVTFSVTPPRSPTGQSYRVRMDPVGARPGATSPVAELSVSPRAVVPRLLIETVEDAPIESGDDYVAGTMTLEPNESGLAPFALPGRFRVRGNGTSYARVKLSYKVKLDKKASVAGFPASKDWALLANFYDRSLLRTDLALEASRRIGLPWTPRMQFAEVVVNGRLQGLYQVGENVEKSADRVALPADGVLMEGDFHDDDDPRFTTSRGLQVYLKDPDDGGEALTNRVSAGVQAAEDSLYSADFADPQTGYRSCLDVDSFVDWYLLNELMKTFDSSFNASIWMSWSGGRVAMAAPWDFDLSAGNRKEFELSDPTGWYLGRSWWAEDGPRPYSMMGGQAQGHWLTRLVQDPWFVQQVRARWAEVAPGLRTLPQHVRAQASDVAQAAGRNFASRADGGAEQPIGPTFLDPESVAVYHGSWPAETDALAEWIDARVTWMDDQLADPAP